MDFMKDFGRVWHAGLLHKLAAAGLTTPSIAWLTSYLSTRTITVTVGSTQSKEHSNRWCTTGLTPWASSIYCLHQRHARQVINHHNITDKNGPLCR